MMSSVRRLPVPGEIIESKHESACFNEAYRVLDVCDGELDRIIAIPITPRRSKGRTYFVGPRVFKLSKIAEELNCLWLAISEKGVTPRADASATCADLDKKYLRPGLAISNPRREREARYSIIKPLVDDPEDRKLLLDPQVRAERVALRASQLHAGGKTLARLKKQINELVYQYLAGGSDEGALTPFSGAKGGRGKERTQKSKLGRQNSPTAAKQAGVEGFVMFEQDKDICGFAWRNYYIRGTTIAKALRRMWREFYSTTEIDARGNIVKTILPIHQRPTRSQFVRWGILRSPGHESWKKQLTKFNLNRIGRALFGTSTDDVVAVGQRGAVDSTSPDLEFVSVLNRLDRIGPAHRILVVDSMFGYISGFYLGLDAPSAETVQLAFLHSLTDKTEWLEWLGLDDQDPTNWIPIRYATVLADNTDLRCEAVKEVLKRIGTGIKFVGVARSDLNAPAEVSHHVLHRRVDHNLHGTTHGQRHERGEERADILARHTIIEAIRETARAIYTHNTMELDIRPTLEMRRELLDKGIKLTRANLTRWMMNKGKVAVSLIGADEARTKLLLGTRGTFTQYGIKLLRPDTGGKREFVEPIKYVNNHPLILEKVMKAKVGRSRVSPLSHDDDFLYDPYKPTEIFYRNHNDGELIRLELRTKDEDLPYECAYHDILNKMQSDSLYRFEARAAAEEALSKMEAGQEGTKQEASDAYNDALDDLEKPLSKAALRRGKKENREREKELYRNGMPIQMPPDTNEGGVQPDDIPPVDPSSDEAKPVNHVQVGGNGEPQKVDATPSGNARPTNSAILQSILARRQREITHEH